MLTRIAVFGDDSEKAMALAQWAREKGAAAMVVEPGSPVPAHTSCLALTGAASDTAMDSMLAAAHMNDEMLLLLAAALDAREDIPAESSERLRRCTVLFAEALGMEREEASLLERGALLRGIGKTRISNATLLKQSVLDYDDWILLQSHTTLGAEVLLRCGASPEVADIARCYHECWDGTGYPDRIEGEAIPRFARIVRIVDVYCAMTSPRLYRKGHASHAEAVAHLSSERGKHFAADLVDVFIAADIGQNLQ